MDFASGLLLLFEPVLFEARQRGHARVGRVGLAAAIFAVEVRSTVGAQTTAVASADDFHRESQDDLLGQDVGLPRPPLAPLPEAALLVLRDALAQFAEIPV